MPGWRVSDDSVKARNSSRSTSFEAPWFPVGEAGVRYYAVDHSPSYLWQAATFENSLALMPFLPDVMAGPEAWLNNATLAKALEIHDGKILNPRILRFQNRDEAYPHPPKT